jgi:hypothetical protein
LPLEEIEKRNAPVHKVSRFAISEFTLNVSPPFLSLVSIMCFALKQFAVLLPTDYDSAIFIGVKHVANACIPRQPGEQGGASSPR